MACGGTCGCDDCRACVPQGTAPAAEVLSSSEREGGARARRSRPRRIARVPDGSDGAAGDDAVREPDAFDAVGGDGDREAVAPPQTVEPRPEPIELPAWLLDAMQRREAESEPLESGHDAAAAEVATPEATSAAREGGSRRADGLSAPRAYFEEPASQPRGKGGGTDGGQRYVAPGGGVPEGSAERPSGDPAAAVRELAPDWAVVDLGSVDVPRRATPGWDDAPPASASGPVTTPSSPPAVDSRVCPCDCVCVPAPATQSEFALLPATARRDRASSRPR